MKLTLSQLLSRKSALPVAPDAVLRLMAALDEPESTADQIVSEMTTDPVLTGHAIRAANSPLVSAGRRVMSPLDAVRMLGMDRVRALAVASALRGRFHVVGADKLDAVWSVSMLAADIAVALARLTGFNATAAYTAGLLHAVGLFVMHAGMPEEMAALDALDSPLSPARPRLEMDRFGYCYAQAGAALLRTWGVPSRLADAVGNQFSPLDADHGEALAGIVSLAGWRARAEYLGMDHSMQVATYPDDVGLMLDLDHDMMLNAVRSRDDLPSRPLAD